MQSATWISSLGLDSLVAAGRLIGKDATIYTRPYGMEMSRGLDGGVDCYLLEQEKPIVAFIAKESEQEAEQALLTLGGKIWNQGLANVLVLYLPEKVKIYSLLDKDSANASLPHCIYTINENIKEATQRHLQEIEEGVFFHTHADYFRQINRVDKRLLENLKKARTELTMGAYPLSRDVAQALLLQILFIAYLEDRKIVPEVDFLSATQGAHSSLSDLLAAGDISALKILFQAMREQFNGDMFLAPGVFTHLKNSAAFPVLHENHLRFLHGLRSGNISATGQFSLFRLYNFEYIPVSLLSAIYDHFQNEPGQLEEKGQRKGDTVKRSTGSYFTPAHLAQTCVSLAWKYFPKEAGQKNDFYVLDPACGSAVFLVCVFQRLAGWIRVARKLQAVGISQRASFASAWLRQGKVCTGRRHSFALHCFVGIYGTTSLV